MAVTLKELGKELHISCQAISAVLNNKSNCRVSQKNRERILQTAREKGYQSNFGFQVMRGNATKTVAVILASERRRNEEFVQHLLLLLLDQLNAMGYAVYSNNHMGRDANANLAQIRDLIRRGVEHFIFIGAPCGENMIPAEILKHKKTYIGFQTIFPHDLQIDTTWGVEEIIRYFQSEVGDQFAFILPRSPHTGLYDAKRIQALVNLYPGIPREELTEQFVFELSCQQWEVSSSVKAFEHGYRSMEAILRTRPDLKAFFYLSDSFALGAAAYLHRQGKIVGRDVLLSGVNNDSTVQYHALPICSIEYPIPEICRILLEEFRSGEQVSRTIKPVVHIRTLDHEMYPFLTDKKDQKAHEPYQPKICRSF